MNCPHCDKQVENMIPIDRFNEVNDQKKRAALELENMKNQLVEQDQLKAQIAELGKSLETSKTAANDQLTIARAGIVDADDAADLMALFRRRAGDDVSLSDWLNNRDELPRAARALFAESAPAIATPPPTTNGTPQTESESTPRPQSNKGAAHITPAPAAYSAAEISKMTRAEYRQHRSAILASIGKN